MTTVALVGLALALGCDRVVSATLDRLAGGEPGDVAVRLRRSDLSKVVSAGLVLAYVLLVEGRSLASIGVHPVPPLAFAGFVAGGLAATLAASAVADAVAGRVGLDNSGEALAELGRLSTAQRLRIALVAGITEEVLFRGYLVERLVELLGSPLLAGGVSLVAFVVAHYGFWDAEESVGIAAVTAALVALYLWTRSLPVVVAVHVLHDSIGLLLAGRLGGDEEERALDGRASAE